MSTLPTAAQDQLRAALSTAMTTPTGVSPLFGKVPDLSALADVKDQALEALDVVLGAIDTVQRYAWLLGKYAGPVQQLEDALRRVRTWID